MCVCACVHACLRFFMFRCVCIVHVSKQAYDSTRACTRLVVHTGLSYVHLSKTSAVRTGSIWKWLKIAWDDGLLPVVSTPALCLLDGGSKPVSRAEYTDDVLSLFAWASSGLSQTGTIVNWVELVEVSWARVVICNKTNWSWLITIANAVFQCIKLGVLTNKLIYENSVVERFLSSSGFLDSSIWRQYVPSKLRDVVNPWHSVYPRRKELSATPLREALNSQNYLPFKPLIQVPVISVYLNKKH